MRHASSLLQRAAASTTDRKSNWSRISRRVRSVNRATACSQVTRAWRTRACLATRSLFRGQSLIQPGCFLLQHTTPGMCRLCSQKQHVGCLVMQPASQPPAQSLRRSHHEARVCLHMRHTWCTHTYTHAHIHTCTHTFTQCPPQSTTLHSQL